MVNTLSTVTIRNAQRSSLLGMISDTRNRIGSTKDSTTDKNTWRFIPWASPSGGIRAQP